MSVCASADGRFSRVWLVIELTAVCVASSIICSRSSPLREGVIEISRLGRTSSETSRERKIIQAVSTPNVSNIGIGAIAITKKPVIDVTAEIAGSPGSGSVHARIPR
jgi:hypothetical protein